MGMPPNDNYSTKIPKSTSISQDTANHNSDLARPVGNVLTNDVSINIIDQNRSYVNL